jgi:ABC-2 type transport system permease protein
MLRGLWRLTWLEIKIFMREPMGFIGSVALPVVIFLVLGRISRGRAGTGRVPGFMGPDLAILAALLIALSAVLSLVTIISIYREGGILKRLRATPLRPHTILGAHVLVKLLFSALTLAALVLAGKRYYPAGMDAALVPFVLAVLFSTASILSMGFVIASLVPTARFAQPIGTVLLYPMLGLSGLFVPLESLPPMLRTVSRALPLTYAVSLMKGMWRGDAWAAHSGDLAALTLVILVCTVLSARVFRWE